MIAPEPAEIEIKFLLPEGSAAAFEDHSVLRGGEAASPLHTTTTYYDTVDRAFARAGASLRLRRAGSQWVQTLKLRDGSGPFGRGEWEWTAKGTRLDPRHLAETPLAGLGEEELIPVFTVEVVRRTRSLRHEGATIEIVVDEGTIRAGDRIETVREAELELKEGSPAALCHLAAILQADLSLVLGAESKSDRGWRLLTGEPLKGGKARDIDLPRDVVAAEAFRRIVASLLASLLAHQPAAAVGRMEAVHGMRIATRRLRALLALFGPCLAAVPGAAFTAGLRDLAAVLGEARDWDVFVTETLPRADGAGTSLLRPLAEAERRMAHRRVAEELGGPAVSRLVLGLAAWTEDLAALAGEAGGGALGQPLLDLAPDLLARLDRKARRRGRRIRRRSETELHDLRKALKKLRYGVEFLSPLHKPKRLSAYLHQTRRLQETLGVINDAAVATALAARLVEHDAALAPGALALRAWADLRQEEAHNALRKAWRAFRDAHLPRPIR
ncbi:CHAD domain-containing protein [Roseomonas nepalensis]|uniref:CHAD domain-containing protein n=1 Tax=Muricoccus nepalensis TaxID=1854500 RepID=A0A502FFB4_9PROT|nr:CYTH and CHAD domain-containing protein [Roseomonas nepalensis]TPG48120.1 CHAD domain-containing protein [Roseomonas nepalensis]